MSEQLTLTPQECFAKDGQHARLQPLIVACMQRQGALLLELSEQAVYLRVEDAPGRGAPLRLTGQPSVPDLNLSAIDQVGAKLILPLLFDIQTLCIPHRQIFYCGREFRSIADFFARNLFHAAVRNASFDTRAVPTHQFLESAKQFRREYYYVFNHMLPEEQLKSRGLNESINLIALNACLGVQYFSHSILNNSLGSAHPVSHHHNAVNHMAALKMRLLETRSALLALG